MISSVHGFDHGPVPMARVRILRVGIKLISIDGIERDLPYTFGDLCVLSANFLQTSLAEDRGGGSFVVGMAHRRGGVDAIRCSRAEASIVSVMFCDVVESRLIQTNCH